MAQNNLMCLASDFKDINTGGQIQENAMMPVCIQTHLLSPHNTASQICHNEFLPTRSIAIRNQEQFTIGRIGIEHIAAVWDFCCRQLFHKVFKQSTITLATMFQELVHKINAPIPIVG